MLDKIKKAALSSLEKAAFKSELIQSISMFFCISVLFPVLFGRFCTSPFNLEASRRITRGAFFI